MTDKKKLKRIIRERAAERGITYSEAHRQVTGGPPLVKAATPGVPPPAEPGEQASRRLKVRMEWAHDDEMRGGAIPLCYSVHLDRQECGRITVRVHTDDRILRSTRSGSDNQVSGLSPIEEDRAIEMIRAVVLRDLAEHHDSGGPDVAEDWGE